MTPRRTLLTLSEVDQGMHPFAAPSANLTHWVVDITAAFASHVNENQ